MPRERHVPPPLRVSPPCARVSRADHSTSMSHRPSRGHRASHHRRDDDDSDDSRRFDDDLSQRSGPSDSSRATSTTASSSSRRRRHRATRSMPSSPLGRGTNARDGDAISMMMDSAAVGTPTADAFADEPPWTTLTVTARAFADGTPVHAARKRRFCAVMEGLANGGARGVYEAARCPGCLLYTSPSPRD